ncbi:MAG: hypothetical protein RL632_1473 [Bacteroidota bacterium]
MSSSKIASVGILLFWFNAWTQTALQCIPSIDTEPILLEKEYIIGNESWRFQTVKFYISAFTAVSGNGKVQNRIPTVLIDLEDPLSQSLGQLDPAVERIDFLLGTDSLSNVLGILEGALDPINGMYWAWNSGYINVKTEGLYRDSTGKEFPFEFHIGGYLAPNETVRSLSFSVNPENGVPQLVIHMDEWLKFAFENGIYSLMIPGKMAAVLATKVHDSFQLIYRHE